MNERAGDEEGFDRRRHLGNRRDERVRVELDNSLAAGDPDRASGVGDDDA
jgi:hypothetical protein